MIIEIITKLGVVVPFFTTRSILFQLFCIFYTQTYSAIQFSYCKSAEQGVKSCI